MVPDNVLAERVLLTALGTEHVTERYRHWMNDRTVTQYLESRFEPLSLEQLESYVREMRESPDNYLFGIISREDESHLGNIKLGPVDRRHLRAPVGLILGEPNVWGKGIAAESIRALSRWAFETLGLEKLTAGAYASNVGSIRAFEKAGYRIEGRHISEVLLDDGTRDDVVLLGLTRESSSP